MKNFTTKFEIKLKTKYAYIRYEIICLRQKLRQDVSRKCRIISVEFQMKKHSQIDCSRRSIFFNIVVRDRTINEQMNEIDRIEFIEFYAFLFFRDY